MPPMTQEAISQHVLEELRLLRGEIVQSQRETRVVIDRMKDAHNTELGAIYRLVNDVNVAMVERNSARQVEHKELAQKVSMYAAGISVAVGIAVSALKDFFFR